MKAAENKRPNAPTSALPNSTFCNVPRLRFPGFEGEWEKKTLGECCLGFDYGMNASAKPYDGVNGYIRITDIDEDTSEFKKSGIVSPDAEIDESYRVTENDILFARTGASTGKTYRYKPDDGRLYFAGFLIRAKISPYFDSKFIFYQTQSGRYKKWVQIMSMRSGQPGINSQEYASFLVNLPQKSEQMKISSLLSLIDQRISIQNKTIEDLKKLKSALCEQAYQSQENIDRPLSELIRQVSGRNKGNLINRVLSVSNKLGFIEQSEQFEDRAIASDDTSNYKIVSPNDFAYNPARINVGSIARLKDGNCGIVSPMYICFRTDPSILPEYLEFFFNTRYFQTEVQKRLEGSVRLCLSFDGLCDIPIPLPTIEIQKSIKNRLIAVTRKIEMESRICELLQNQKTFLLNNLFV